MTVLEIYQKLNEKIPPALSCDWDNDGIMCCPEVTREAKKALVTLDITADAVQYAIDTGCDLIVSHHPLLFRGVKHLSTEDVIAHRAIDLCRAGISAFSFHTRLDALPGGVNDTLASLLHLENVTSFGSEAFPIGRVGNLSRALPLRTFCAILKETLGCPALLAADAGKDVFRVALVGGEGGDDIAAAQMTGADTYLSGRLGYHAMTDAAEGCMNMIEAGHYYTEQPVTQTLARFLHEIDENIQILPFCSNRILTI